MVFFGKKILLEIEPRKEPMLGSKDVCSFDVDVQNPESCTSLVVYTNLRYTMISCLMGGKK